MDKVKEAKAGQQEDPGYQSDKLGVHAPAFYLSVMAWYANQLKSAGTLLVCPFPVA
jgi:hypothetical protein